MKKLIGIIGTLVIAFGLVGCFDKGKTTSNESSENGKINVVASIYPLEQFTKMIGGNKVNVLTLVPQGQEPHDFEPKTQDFKTLTESDIFVYNGLGLEHWLSDVKDSLKEKNVLMVDSSKGVDVIKDGDKVDPHIWLSLKDAIVQANNIKNALIEKDPDNKNYYEENYKELEKEFNGLYEEYKPKFKELKKRDFITGHAAFGYLCREFNLNQKSISNLFGEGEPTPKKLEELSKYCKDNNIKVIFSESLAEPKTSETLAKEAGAKVEKIYSLESSEDNKTYLEGMRYNLDVIYNSLVEENK